MRGGPSGLPGDPPRWQARHMRVVLVVNPFATRVSEERLAEVRAELERVAELDIVLTERPGHATELVTEAGRGGAEAVVVFSGDGGFNEAVNGLESDVPIGFLPGGGTSVLSRALGLPRDAIAAAQQVAEALAAGRTRRISLGRVNGRGSPLARVLGCRPTSCAGWTLLGATAT